MTAPLRITTPACTWDCTSPGGPIRLIAASRHTPATIAITPAATPSAPSSRFTDTCMPTSHTTVTGALNHMRSMTDGECDPGMAIVVMVIPKSTASTPAPTSIPSLLRHERSRMSSIAMATVIAAVTARTCQRSAMLEPKIAIATAKPANIAIPPSLGVVCRWRWRAPSGSATAPARRASQIDPGTAAMQTALATRNGGSAVSQGESAAITPAAIPGMAGGSAGRARGSGHARRPAPRHRRSR